MASQNKKFIKYCSITMPYKYLHCTCMNVDVMVCVCQT